LLARLIKGEDLPKLTTFFDRQKVFGESSTL